MQDLAIFSVSSQRSRWLAARISVISNNIANADTPGFKARDVAPFDSALEAAGTVATRTSRNHLAPSGGSPGAFSVAPREGGAQKHSGNTVGLESELMQLGDMRSQHSLVSGVVGAFNRMLLQSVRS